MGLLDFLKVKKYKKEIESLNKKIIDIQLTKDELAYINIRKELSNIETKLEDTQKELNKLEDLVSSKSAECLFYDDILDMQSYGLYETRYGLEDSEKYKKQLDSIRNKQKDMIKNKTATSHSLRWSLEGSEVKGKRFILDTVKISLRAFNNECDNIISKVKYSNVMKSVDKLHKIHKSINGLTDMQRVSITEEYLNLKIEELYLKYEYECKKQEEKEEQQRIREQLKEEAKVLKEIENALKKAEKEEMHFLNAKRDLEVKLYANSNDSEKIKLKEKIEELEQKLKELTVVKEDILNREKNNKAGYVYIISNIGSFGEDVYKIGVTRRLDPEERIKELSSASVPFKFDIHAMIFSVDAFDLENKLHKRFDAYRVNKVNNRKEFFKLPLDEIESVVNEEFDKVVDFIKYSKAEEYRQSQKLLNDIN